MSYPLSMAIKVLSVLLALGLAGIIFYFFFRKIFRKKEFPYLSENVPTPRDVYLKIHQKKRKNGQNSDI